MFTTSRRRRQLARVRPGDGSPLPAYRLWHLATRAEDEHGLEPTWVGTLVLPYTLSAGWLTTIGIVGALAAAERALTLRSPWLRARRR